MKEFAIINQYFKDNCFQRKDVLFGIGDDCAITCLPEGQSLAITTDTLVAGVHFDPAEDAKAIAHKALAVNLSDLAAIGAEPAWLSLSLSLPKADPQWLQDFAIGLKELSEYYSVQLIGGDTVQGPMSITITAHGFVPKDKALTRNRAKPGDALYVTGTLGDAGLGLALARGELSADGKHKQFLLNRLHYPTPRVLVGTMLRRVAHACIDLSDGLVSDLQHVLDASGCGANVQVDKLPLSDAMLASTDKEHAQRLALGAGDDYELLFTVPEEHKGNLDMALAAANVPITCIGHMTGIAGQLELTLNEQPYQLEQSGYEHFA